MPTRYVGWALLIPTDKKSPTAMVGLLVLSAELFHTETLFESVNTTAGINKFLTTGVERMAFGANFYVDILLGGTGLPYLTASTGDGCGLVVRMNSFFHSMSPLSLELCITSPFFTSVLL